MIDSFLLFFQKESTFLIAIFLFLAIELVSRQMRKKLKESVFTQYDSSTDPKHSEYYLEYYRKSQIIDVVRVLSLIGLITYLIMSRTNAGGNILVVAAGALIITFRDFLMSVIAFFAVLPRYGIGDTIAIGGFQGQIIYIRMFSIGLIGKDSDGDSTGQQYVIPSHKFLSETITREDLNSTSIRKELIKIPYKKQEFELPFSEFIMALEAYLDTILPVPNRKTVGNYQTYIGHRYKLDIDYLEDKCIMITIGIVGKWSEITLKKKTIIRWTEEKRIEMKKK